MTKIGKAIARAVQGFADANKPGEYEAGGRQVVCPHCGGTLFAEGAAQLNTAGMTFFGLDWLNESAATLVCAACGYIQWFLTRPQRGRGQAQGHLPPPKV